MDNTDETLLPEIHFIYASARPEIMAQGNGTI